MNNLLVAVCGGIFRKFVKRNKYLMMRNNIPTRIYARPRRTISIVSLHYFRSAITAKRRCHHRNGVVCFFRNNHDDDYDGSNNEVYCVFAFWSNCAKKHSGINNTIT